MYITCLDVEGVLVPEIWIAFAETSGIPELKKTTRDEPDYDKLMKWRLGVLKEHGLGLKEIQDVIRTIDPLPGAKEFLTYLNDHGIKAGIATSNGREMVEAVLESLGVRGFFQVVTTACEVNAGKPAPDIYLCVAEKLGVKPEDCMVFEDVPAGILAGKRAGMTVYAIEDEFSRKMEAEKRELADGYIRDYFELLGAKK